MIHMIMNVMQNSHCEKDVSEIFHEHWKNSFFRFICCTHFLLACTHTKYVVFLHYV